MTTLSEDLDSAVALEHLMSEAAEEAYAKSPTKDEKAAAHLAAIKDTDIDHLLGLQDKMKSVIDKITANAIDLDNLGELTPQQAEALMVELLDQKDIEALLELRYNMIRAAVFAHITVQNAQRKVAYPDRAPGEIPVPSLGKRFTREGGKMKGDFDKVKLAQLLTKEQYDRIFKIREIPEQVIPAHTEEYRDDEALKALVMENPALLEVLRAAVVPVGFTNSSFHVRKLTKG